MTQDVKFDHLPDEILVNIFSYFGFSDLLDIIQNVCGRWRRVSQASVLWKNKELIISGNTQDVVVGRGPLCRCVKMDEAICIAKRVPELRRLTVEYMDRRKISKLCEYTPNITHLEVYKYRYTRPSCTLFEDVFEKCREIKHLTLAFRELENRETAQLVSRLQHLSCLRVVGVPDNTWRPGQLQLQLRVLADGCPRLQEMHLIWDDYDNARIEGYCVVPEFYRKFAVEEFKYFLETKQSSLTFITLPWMIGRKRCVVPLLAQCNTNLTKLELDHFNVPPELEGEAFEALGVLRSLHELSMPDISPSQPQLLSLSFQPGKLTQLRRLQLHKAFNLSDENVVAISRGCPSLCELRITFSRKITDAGLTDISRLKSLKIGLELSGCNKLGGAAMAHIANLQALHTLVLQHIDNLAKLQPSLRLIVDMDELRCLDIAYSLNSAAVPFDAFPGRLVNLRQLHVSCHKGEKKLSELQKRMPRLQIVNPSNC